MFRQIFMAILGLSLIVSAPATTIDPFASARACLAAAAWNEARGRPDVEIIAVMHVVRNRTEQANRPHNICGVVMERGQFHLNAQAKSLLYNARFPRHDGPEAPEKLLTLAEFVLNGDSIDPTHGATHFYTPRLRRVMGLSAAPDWARRLRLTASIGEFRFHKEV